MIEKVINNYLGQFPSDRKKLGVLLKQLKAHEGLQSRQNYTGHVVGSAVIISPDYKKIVLIYHPTLERWQQPGGHWDPGETGPWQAAKREAIEETGVKLGKQIFTYDARTPILIESHPVPAKPPKNEPLHYHHAFWYVFVAKSSTMKLEDEVITKAEWVEIKDIKDTNIKRVLSRVDKQLKALATNRTIKSL